MNIEDMQRKYKEYLKDINDRGYELLWSAYFHDIKKFNQEYNVISQQQNSTLPPIDKIKSDYFSLAADQNEKEYFIQKSHIIIKNRILPEEYTSWIPKDNNLINYWLIDRLNEYKSQFLGYTKIDNKKIYSAIYDRKFITNNYNEEKLKLITTPITVLFRKESKYLYDTFIYRLDTSNTTLHQKICFLDSARNEYNSKNLFEIKFNKWIDKKNTEQLEWINDYLLKKIPFAPFYKPDLINAIATTDLYSSILLRLSSFNFDHYASRNLFVEKIKKSWSQKKFRDEGKTKKPHHLPLTKESIRQLQQLSQLMNMKEQKIIETLIDEKFHEVATKDGKTLY
ncbi:hypothetical protein BJD20_06735 [Acinetobacter proteolyticus]|uniref:hypothetical protein n=1 Tax=Acinetobacter proteolyticus TaxID=1776741 RepID=UPI0008632645|nr:hypothetical protein [Acinetobacter proteolyticus]OEY93029.1 hypothetical protein BJD20_06735 [Acinetobacter proteolyticus]